MNAYAIDDGKLAHGSVAPQGTFESGLQRTIECIARIGGWTGTGAIYRGERLGLSGDGRSSPVTKANGAS